MALGAICSGPRDRCSYFCTLLRRITEVESRLHLITMGGATICACKSSRVGRKSPSPSVQPRLPRGVAWLIQVSDPDGVALIYQYENQLLADATRARHIHFGAAMLRVSDDNKLTGDYYAGRDRGTFVRISCCRLPRTIRQALGALRPRLTGSSSHQ